VPGPSPLAPEVTVIHPALATAVHVQPAVVLTPNDPAPPPTATVCDVGESVNAQPFA
jgi:hypothetical protein